MAEITVQNLIDEAACIHLKEKTTECEEDMHVLLKLLDKWHDQEPFLQRMLLQGIYVGRITTEIQESFGRLGLEIPEGGKNAMAHILRNIINDMVKNPKTYMSRVTDSIADEAVNNIIDDLPF